MLKIFNTRVARLLLATVIVVCLTIVAASRLLYDTSIEAVVSAPRIDVQAPTDGELGAIAIAPGRTVKHGAPLFELRRDEYSRGSENELGVRVGALRDRRATLTAQVAKLRTLRDSLAQRVDAYRLASVAQLGAASASAKAKSDERTLNLERVAALQSVNGSTSADVERARAEATVATADAQSAHAALAAAERGVVTGQGAQDVPYSQQRMDELTVQLANLGASLELVQSELRGLERTSSNADASVKADGTIAVHAMVDGVVWSMPHAAGEHVDKGATLVTLIDCSRLYLDAMINAREQDRIQPGAVVRLRLAGTTREFGGTVAYVRGGGVREDATDAAQLTLSNRANDSHAIILVAASAINALPGNFCQVGRSAKVIFDGPQFSVASGLRSLAKR